MLHQIGVGALGPVFRTYEPTRDRLVAVKVFRLDVTPEQARALADELARAADAGLFHPSIVEPLAAGIEGTVAYRAEEYVAAESLDVAMRHYAPATVDKMLPFITQLASAIDFARAAGVGHGALHPRDIFVTPDEARATGFGVVDALDRMGLRAPVRRPYSPPERIAGQPWSTQADVFSLAVIAFELLTGRRPSGLGAEMGSLSGAALGEHSEAVRVVLARAMQENPYERHPTAQGFSAALAQAARLAEPTVSLAIRGVSAPDALSGKPAIRVVPVDPAAGASREQTVSRDQGIDDLPLTVPAPLDQPVRDLVIQYDAAPESSTPDADRELDDSPTESEPRSAGDSPREVARKMIAAREVRKRQQVKKKPETPVDVHSTDASLPLPAEASPLPADPVAGALFDVATTEAPPPAPDIPPAVPDTPSPIRLDAVDELAKESIDTATAGPTPKSEPKSDAKLDPKLDLEFEPTLDNEHDEDEPSQVAALRAVDLALASREPDRVVAVDEFRGRDIAGPKPDRSWPRGPERIAPGRLDSGRSEADTARPERLVMPKVSPIESIDTDVTPLAVDASPAERQRMAMLPAALLLSLGLILGYAAGYLRGSREAVASGGTAVAPASSESQTPTTGRTAAKETTEQVVTPESTPTAPSPAAPTPTPAPPRAVRPAATTGRIVISSTPAKAAVVINGKWSGRTPLTVDDLKFGKYAIRIVEPGYEVARAQFTLSAADAAQSMNVTLRRARGEKRAPAPDARAPQVPPPASPSAKPTVPATGEIFVDSRPRGARVFINDKELGVTPLRLAGQPVGSHVVRLELADHRSWTVTAKVVAQKTAPVTGSLERIR